MTSHQVTGCVPGIDQRRYPRTYLPKVSASVVHQVDIAVWDVVFEDVELAVQDPVLQTLLGRPVLRRW